MKRDRRGRFTSEGLKGNKFALGNPPNKTSFKNGHLPHTFKGCIQKHQSGFVKYDLKKKKRSSYAKHVFEKEYGKIPKGYVIYHLDGDQYNNDLDNLEAISRAELLRRNKLYSAYSSR